MNILDAIKSGKRFYRKSWPVSGNSISFDEIGKLSIAAILAEDWEVEEREVTIKESQFEQAWNTLYRLMKDKCSPDYIKANLKKELGL